MAEPSYSTDRFRDSSQAIQELQRNFGHDQFSSVAYRQILNALQREGSEVLAALESSEDRLLLGLSREALAGLIAVTAGASREEVEWFLTESGVDESEKEFFFHVWAVAKPHEERLEAIGNTVLDKMSWAASLSLNTLEEIQLQLERQRNQKNREDVALIQSQKRALDSLVELLVSTGDVSVRLVQLATEPRFRNVLDLLADADSMVPASQNPAVVALAQEYAVLTSAWLDARLEPYGRINHWVSVDHQFSRNLRSNFPQIDLRVFSFGKELFRTRDDVDDILDLARQLTRLCAECLEQATRGEDVLPPYLEFALGETVALIESDIDRIRVHARGEQGENA